MDFLTKKELDALKGDIKSKDIAIEASKNIFENQLKNQLGNDIIKTLTNAKKVQPVETKNPLKRIIDLLTKWRIKTP